MWVALLLLGVGVVVVGLVVFFKPEIVEHSHATSMSSGDKKFATTHVGLALVALGFVFILILLWARPETTIPQPVASANEVAVQTRTVTATPPVSLPAHVGAPSLPTASAAGTAPLQPTRQSGQQSCAGVAGPWSGDLNGLQIVISDVTAPSAAPGQLTFTFRIENHSTSSVQINNSQVMVVDSNEKQYEITSEGFDWMWPIAKGEIKPGTMTLASPLQGSPTSVELRFNIDQSFNHYDTLPICVPVRQ
ncbi:hypothetical protein [Mycolicibacterium mucogenicum]|uniref:hypothetical protein n=1 Tax=Mycolicibacterium mucogenicum TaxID=56689 RepID=UPI001041EE37|nr:hypothetical protein [Mycolicibacterium mucogenicum]